MGAVFHRGRRFWEKCFRRGRGRSYGEEAQNLGGLCI